MRGRRASAVICALFALVGVAILVFGGAQGRALGAMCVLFFGIGGLALAAPLLTRARGVELTEGGFLFPISRAKQLVFTLAGAGLTAACVLIALAGGLVVGILGLVVFGGFTLGLLGGLRRRRGLVVTPTHVVVDFNGRAEVAWDDVEEIALREQFRSRYIAIRATAPGRVERTSGAWLARLNRGMAAADLLVPADSLAGDAEHAVRVLGHYLEDPAARRSIGTADELARVI